MTCSRIFLNSFTWISSMKFLKVKKHFNSSPTSSQNVQIHFLCQVLKIISVLLAAIPETLCQCEIKTKTVSESADEKRENSNWERSKKIIRHNTISSRFFFILFKNSWNEMNQFHKNSTNEMNQFHEKKFMEYVYKNFCEIELFDFRDFWFGLFRTKIYRK